MANKSKAPQVSSTTTSSRGRWVILAGGVISRLGHVSIPFGVGIIVGFYFSDREMRLVPTALEISLGLFIFGFLSVPLGRYLQDKAFEITDAQKRIRKRIVAFGVLASLAVLARLFLYWTEEPSPLTELDESKFDIAYEIDANRYKHLDATLEEAATYLKAQKDLFGKDSAKVLTADQEREILSAWQTVTDAAFALDQIRMFFEDWYRFDISRLERSYHLKSFLLMFAAELSIYRNGLEIVDTIDNNKNAVKFLDAPHRNIGLAADSFSKFREDTLGARDEAIVASGQQYLRFLETGFEGRREAKALGVGWLWQDVEHRLQDLRSRNPLDKATRGAAADLQSIKRVTRRNWFTVQKSMAIWMGDTRVRRIGTYIITPEQQEQIEKELVPGDILIARKNWYLSNVGLPGFWPHAILYLGDPQKFETYFDTPEVRLFLQELTGTNQTLSQYLASTKPNAWRAYLEQDHGEVRRCIEAVSEGVVFSTLGHTTGDYFAAMRPTLDKKAKAQAVIEAFRHVFKPYDFDFDFATDHALVCTELVWRSYRPAEGKDGIDIPLVSLMGRKTLPANDIAGYFADQKNSPTKSLEFVLFYDANEKEGRSFKSTKQAFTLSHERTKWDLALP